MRRQFPSVKVGNWRKQELLPRRERVDRRCRSRSIFAICFRYKPPRCLVWVGRSHATPFCGVSGFGWEPFLRPDLTSPGRRAEPRSRMARPFAGHRALARRAASLTAASTAPRSVRSGTLPRAAGRARYPLQTAKNQTSGNHGFRIAAEKRRFWKSHDSADQLDWSKAAPARLPALHPSTTAISLRLPVPLLERIKIAANKSDIPYQSLIKAWPAEKLERG